MAHIDASRSEDEISNSCTSLRYSNMETTADAKHCLFGFAHLPKDRTWRHGFGYSIQDFRGIPYQTENEDKRAESAIRKALGAAIDISKG